VIGAAVAALAVAVVAATPAPGSRGALRVCADPNNLPFSNRAGEGFENRIAERLAGAMGVELRYTWWPQRRGFLRNTLAAGRCDVVMGITRAVEGVAPTRPYYRSSYVFATGPGRPPVASFDDPALRRLRVGVALVGDDGVNPPPEQALARRGIIDNVVGFTVFGDYARPDPALDPLRALARGDVDVVAVWGPLAGYFGHRERLALTLTPVSPAHDAGVPFVFEIAAGVRPGPADAELRRRLDRALFQQRASIDRILDEYGIPRI
jgi:mxaJ protein